MHPVNKTKSDIFIILVFLVVLCLPAITFVFGIPDSDKVGENRVLARRPAVPKNVAALRVFPKVFEDYFDDHFSFRKHFIRWNNIVEVLMLGVSPGLRKPVSHNASRENKHSHHQYFNGILTGENHWYYWAADGMIADYRGFNPFSRKELLHWKRVLEKRRSWLQDQGIAYMVVMVPEKHTIYPENLPSNIHPPKAPSRLDQLVRYMNKHSDLDVVDFRDTFFQAKQLYKYPLYNPTGTHWNDFGAFLAYRLMITTASGQIPCLKPLPLSSFSTETKTTNARPFLNLLGLRNMVYQETVELHPHRNRRAVTSYTSHPEAAARCEKDVVVSGENIIKETGDAGLPRAVVFHDSFVRHSLETFLSEHFERIEYYWWVEFDPDIILKARPDIVIEEYSERALLSLTLNDKLPND